MWQQGVNVCPPVWVVETLPRCQGEAQDKRGRPLGRLCCCRAASASASGWQGWLVREGWFVKEGWVVNGVCSGSGCLCPRTTAAASLGPA